MLGCAILALSATPASADLPRTYQPMIIDSPEPLGGGAFGWGITSADLTGDGKLDLLVAQAQTGKGQIFIFDGVTGRHVDTINPPEQNPLVPPTGSPPGTPATEPANNETLGFVYVETMPDLGSCRGGDGPDPDKICDLPTIGPGDGIPEIIVGARNLKVNAANGALPPVAADPNIGRGYVFDGATRAVLKRIDMPAADRAAQAVPLGTPPAQASGQNFARVMMNPSGLPPCAGQRQENNNFGVGTCPERPIAERIGDVNGGGQPDIVITARSYRETQATAFPGSPCARAAAGTNCGGVGKAWVYSGEMIAATDPRAILETALLDLRHPKAGATTGGGEYGGNVFRLGDISGDGRPEFVVAAASLPYPVNNPDTDSFPNIGASFTWNAAVQPVTQTTPQGCNVPPCVLKTNVHPEPQQRSRFAHGFNSGRPPGDLGATDTPDFFQPAPLQNVGFADQGRVYIFNGDLSAGGGGEQSFNFATLDDPTPRVGGTFGGSTTGVGNLVSTADAPANEVMVGGYGFDDFTEAVLKAPGDLHIMNAQTNSNLQTIPHPTGTPGDGFGVGLTPMGDLNGDGFLDFASSAYFADIGVTAGAGRAFIFKSDNSPQKALPSSPPASYSTPVTPKVFLAGRCANDTLGTDKDDNLEGTVAGDRMAGYGGNDLIRGLNDDDCLSGGSGNDRLEGGNQQDKLLGNSGDDLLYGGTDRDNMFGGSGADRMVGGFGRDRLYGGSGDDRLSGGSHGDRLFGERGDDRIKAGGAGDGPNRVDAGPGKDVVNVLNGHRDYVLCGAGADRVVADRSDRLNGCERISRRKLK